MISGMFKTLLFCVLSCSISFAEEIKVPDLADVGANCVGNVNLMLRSSAPVNLTTADREKLDASKNERIITEFELIRNSEYGFVMTAEVEDVFDAKKIGRPFEDCEQCAVLRIDLAPSSELSATWKKKDAEVIASFDKRIATAPNNAKLRKEKENALAKLKSSRETIPMRVWIGGNASQFSGWLKGQKKTMMVKPAGLLFYKDPDETHIVSITVSAHLIKD